MFTQINVLSAKSKESDLIVQCGWLAREEGGEKQEGGSAEISLVWKVYGYSTGYSGAPYMVWIYF